ncbi:flagellar hook-associated protein FlgK [Vibrio caribbeanicus]|uniref:Flagellar hook-associated protein 1 n=1 Tax=Vibrio caribbeanicus ATCC BAA-2122 TaxID=796620 RepID=E3BPF1_9VIBR|nr:flagellar hook-associated protein FlgK [Vibrio caribbeanicus]EFP95040.1 flagellar hook-associated protein FlgK [Vibrio caribbeanicus ATCC BAA-2122]
MNLVNIGLTGLNASRVALDVTAQNVANINTPGYSRQQALMASVGGPKHDKLSAGAGVEVPSIRRISDEFLVKQTWQTNSIASYAERYTTNFSQLENTLKADGFSISTGLDKFFNALNDASVTPDSTPLRQQIINEAEALSRRFNTLTESLYNQHKEMSDQRTATVNHANSLMVNIADINNQVVEMRGTGGNPAQLLDERDSLIGELSKLIEVKTTKQADGSLQLSLSSGQPLVIGGDAGQIQALPDAGDPYLAKMQIEFGVQVYPVPGAMGGKMGALNDYQTDILKPYRDALDDMASNLADEVNTVLATGLDLQGNPGAALFEYDPANPAASLNITSITPDQLAFSSDGNHGNSDVLKDLVALSNKAMAVSGFGNTSLNDAFVSMVGKTAIKARQASSDYKAKSLLNEQAIAARDNVSSVNSDEEAANLMTFANAHNANMKVISTANELFESVLRLF